MKKYTNDTHFGFCTDCDKKFEGDKEKVRQSAYNHSRNTGHVVKGQSTYDWLYNEYQEN